MKITVLLENTNNGNPKAEAEHGLSIYIQTLGKNILFDMGQTDMFCRNARMLGIDLADVDFAVLSHGHYDHGGGLGEFLRINSKAKVYINRNAFMPHYNANGKYIGLDCGFADTSRIVFTDSEFIICKGITVYPACPDITGKFTDASMTYGENGARFPEDFRHEQYLEICEKNRKILFSGCSHRGITNIVKMFGPDILVGGFHLSKITDDSLLSEYAGYLDSFDTHYYTCHCTGTEQFEFLKKHMRRLTYLSCGETVEFI